MTAAGIRIGVVGAGSIGSGIAGALALAGAAVRVFDPDPDALAVVPYRIAADLDRLGLDPAAAPVALTQTLAAAIGGADLVLEAAPEEAELKRRLFADLEAVAAPAAVLATTTTVVPIGEIAAGTANPERVVATRWWNPPYLVAVVEVVEAEPTGAATVARTLEILAAAGLNPVAVGGAERLRRVR